VPEVFSSLSLSTIYAVLFGYGLGSIPFGLLLTRLAGHGDLRDVGSGNVGATNVLRTGSKGIAALTLILDAGKGAAAVLIVAHWSADLAVWAALFAVIGHNFPVWLRFKGGKGAAASLGVLLAVHWPFALLCFATWIAIVVVGRISSLAAILSFAVSPLYAAWFAGPDVVPLVSILAVLGSARHYQNLRRLLRGQESKIGTKG
jgi:glycerol-3-phosphate acyltransferase PlsY